MNGVVRRAGAVVGDGIPGALVGRLPEVAALRAALAGLGTGVAVVAVAGDPGIGKTRLLAELTGHARLAGRTVLAGRAAEFEREVPFGVFRNALDDHLEGLDPARVAALDAGHLRLLPNVFPALAAPPDGTGVQLLPAERYRVHRAVRALLEAVAEPAGLVVILDDLHWCDGSSVELLDHLLRHPPKAPVLLALAYRQRQIQARLDHAISGAVRRGTATRLDIGPLTYAEAEALLPAGLSATQRRELYDAGAGNPFYLEVLGRTPPADRVVDTGEGGSVPLPVRAALASEFVALTAAGQRVAHAAAVAGDDFDPGLVHVVADLPEAVVLDAFDELGDRDLIRPGGFTGGFRFRHPLVRNAAYHHAPAGWRLAAHARAAVELDRRGAPVAERARHIATAAAVGDLTAVDVLHAAATDAMRTTPAAAAHWLGSALRLLPREPATTGLRLRLLNLRATALGVTGHLSESRDLLEEILRLLPVGTEQRVMVVTFLTMVEHLLGNHSQARALLMSELASLPEQHGTAAGSLKLGLALSSVMHERVESAWVCEAIEAARGAGDRPLLASALGVGVVASHSFDVANRQTTEWLDEATALVDAMPEAELARRLDAVLFLGWGEMYLERFREALRHLDRALRIARGTGQSHLIGPLQMLEGVVRCLTGDMRRALVALDDALDSVMLTDGDQYRGRILGYKSWVSVWTGDLAGALALGEESVLAAADEDGVDWQSGPAESMLGFARYASGDPEGCLEVMLRAGRGPDLDGVRQVWQARWFETLAAAAVAAGRVEEAAGWAVRAARLPGADRLPRRAGHIRLTQMHALRRDDPRGALRLAREAAQWFLRAGDQLGAAQAHLYAGVAHRDLGNAESAEREIGRARRAFQECGAHPEWLARSVGVSLADPAGLDPAGLGAAGLGVTGPVESGDAVDPRLTPRELSVLRLLAESLTAAAIGRRLDISSGTVHKHLARLYRKLGTTDRLATVLRAQECGLLVDAQAVPEPYGPDRLR